MSKNLKVISVIAVIALTIWHRFGNLKEVFSEYGLVIVSVLCILSLVLILLKSLKQSQHRVLLITIFLLLIMTPSLFLGGNKPGFSPRFIIIYCVGVISLLIIFRKEIELLTNNKSSNS